MQCPQCGNDNGAPNAFCEACGAPLGPTCGACGRNNRRRFCGDCRHPLTAEPPAPAQLLRSLSASGGERKRVTVLFADIRNSTGLIEGIDPEQAAYRMGPAIEAMKDAVHRYEGVVNKVTGDGVMVLFGAPQPQEDHPVRGCLAALAMQDALARLGDPDRQIRVGVHTGEGVVQAVQAEWDLTGNRSFAQEELRLARELMEETGVALFGRLLRDLDDKLARGIRFEPGEPGAAGADAAVSHLGRTG